MILLQYCLILLLSKVNENLTIIKIVTKLSDSSEYAVYHNNYMLRLYTLWPAGKTDIIIGTCYATFNGTSQLLFPAERTLGSCCVKAMGMCSINYLCIDMQRTAASSRAYQCKSKGFYKVVFCPRSS